MGRTRGLGRFAGPIFTIILIVDCLWFAFLEWWIPRENIEVVESDWDLKAFDEAKERWENAGVRRRDTEAREGQQDHR